MEAAEELRIRPATEADAEELLRIRYDAIINLATTTELSEAEARRWAERRDLAWMLRTLREREVYVGIVSDEFVSWVAVLNESLESLYTDPRHARAGIGSALLRFAEELLQRRGVEQIRLEASPNAERFYRKRGYEPIGVHEANAPLMMRKALNPTRRAVSGSEGGVLEP